MTILMDDFEEAEMTQSFLRSLNELSLSTAKFVDVLDSMPAELRGEMVTVLEESNQTQQGLQTTLKTAEQVVTEVKKTLEELQTTSLSINQTAKQATDTANAWQNASDSVRELITVFNSPEPPVTDSPPFGMRDFDNMISHAGQTADKVADAVGQINMTLESSDRVENTIRSMIDHIALRVFQLILVVFALILLLTLLRRKMYEKIIL